MKTNEIITKVRVDLNEVLERVYAESAWQAMISGSRRLTGDNERIVLMRMREVHEDLCTRLSGYVASNEWNVETKETTLTLHGKCPAESVRRVWADTLWSGVMWRMHNAEEGDSLTYHKMWRVSRARVLLLMPTGAENLAPN